MQRRTLISAIGGAPLALVASRHATASTATPLRIVVPYAAGGPTDAMARVLQPGLQGIAETPVIVDNVPGAGGSIGAMNVLRAPADGKTLFLGNNGPSAVTPLILGKSAGFGPADFIPVGLLARSTMMLAISTEVPANDLATFVQYARANPDRLNFASAGVGSLGHLASEYLARQLSLQMTHVAYKGQAPTLTALLANEVQMLLTTPTGAMRSYIDGKRIKLIALTSEQPSPQYPQAALLKEQVPGFVLYSWFSLMARKGTPEPALQALRGTLQQVLGQTELQQKFEGFGLMASWSGPQTVERYISQDLERWGPIIRDKKIQLT